MAPEYGRTPRSRSELVVVDGAPYGLNVSHTDQFNSALLDFLAK